MAAVALMNESASDRDDGWRKLEPVKLHPGQRVIVNGLPCLLQHEALVLMPVEHYRSLSYGARIDDLADPCRGGQW